MTGIKSFFKKMKMPSAFLIILGIMGFIAFLSWFTPGTFTDDNGVEYTQAARTGLFSAFFIYPIKGFMGKTDLIIFLFAIGGFIGVMMESESMEAGMISLIKKLNGREIWAIPILMILFAFGGTTYGMAEETIAFYPIIIPLFILAGFDPLTGFLVLAIGAGTGVAASTVNPFAIGAAAGAAGINSGSGVVHRIIGWLVMTALAIAFVMFYTIRAKRNAEKSAFTKEEIEGYEKDAKTKFEIDNAPKFTARKKLALSIFGLFFVLMVLAIIPWEAFGESSYDMWDGPITFFAKMGEKFDEYLFPIFGGAYSTGFYLGGSVSGGGGAFGLLAILFLLGYFILAMVFKLGDEGSIGTFMRGAKDMLSVSMIIAVANGLGILLKDTGFTLSIMNGVGGAVESLGAVGFTLVIFFAMIILSFLIPSTSGLAAATFGIVGGAATAAFSDPETAVSVTALAITAFSLASGIVNMITPTSAIIMGALEIGKIKYTKYVKTVAPYLGVLTVASILFLTFAALAV